MKARYKHVEQDHVKEIFVYKEQLACLSSGFREKSDDLLLLDLSDVHFEDLLNSFVFLRSLQNVVSDRGEFLCVPCVLQTTKGLRVLKACDKNIYSISDDLFYLVDSEEVDLSSHLLIDLPLSRIKLNRLRMLVPRDDRLKMTLHSVTKQIGNLHTLDLCQSISCDIPRLPKNVELAFLCARENEIVKQVATSNVHPKYMKLEEAHSEDITFESLLTQSYKLSNDTLRKIVSQLLHLKRTCIGNSALCSKINIFWQLPVEHLKEFSCLNELGLSNMKILMAPGEINMLSNLSVLDISHNKIRWLPDELCQLTHLKVFVVNDNLLCRLPEDIGQLSMLQELKAHSNNLAYMPRSIQFLEKLLYLDLYNNEFLSMDYDIQKIPNLVGLDLEQNYFGANFLLIRNIHYDHSKMALRHHWNDSYNRLDGPKPIMSAGSRTNSSLSLSHEISWYTENTITTDSNVCTYSSEEDWDVSENSADEFDPYECPTPRRRSRSPFMLYKSFTSVFCPADIHQARSFDRIKTMLENGTLSWSSQVVEGQFEDV